MVDSGWTSELRDGIRVGGAWLRIVCPFIKEQAIDWLLKQRPKPKQIRVITRFNLGDFADGVSDIAALRKLLDFGAPVRGIKDLHAKVYLFGTRRAIVTSANLTEAGLCRNPEFGMVTNDRAAVRACRSYFDDLWRSGRDDLVRDRLVDWEREVPRYLVTGYAVEDTSELADHGADARMGEPHQRVESGLFGKPQAIVKFLGDSSHRPLASSLGTLEEVKESGCHRVVGFPVNRRPRSVENGAPVFIARFVEGDTRVFGRAVALKHEPGRDDAAPRDLKLRDWRAKWPHYIRVHHAEFVAGTMESGVSLGEMMDALKADSFVPTQQNEERGDGSNTNPRLSVRRQAAARLTDRSYRWLSERLQQAFETHGKIKESEWPKRDQPEFPVDWRPGQAT